MYAYEFSQQRESALTPGLAETVRAETRFTSAALATGETCRRQPADIANTVALLVGPSAGWVSGQTLRANGGLV